MVAPDDKSIGDMAPEIEIITNEEESNTTNAATENHSTINEKASNSNEVVLGTQSVTNQEASENSSAADIISTSSQVGFFSLPPEVRVIVFQHLLLGPFPLAMHLPSAVFPAILNTCKLIRREAFQVHFGENTFFAGFLLPRLSILNIRPIRDTVRNINFLVLLNDASPNRSKLSFIHLINELGSPTNTRGTLLINFVAKPPARIDLLSWYARGLPRFTNFRTIRVEFFGTSARTRAKRFCSLLCPNHELGSSPFFGPVEYFANGRGLQFCPQEYLNSLPLEMEVDWMEHLDGVRLNWNEDYPTNAQYPGDEQEHSKQETGE